MVLKTERLVGGLGDGVGNGNGGGGAGVGWGLEEDEETSLMDFMEEDEEEDEDQGGEEAEQQQQQPDRLVSLLQQAYAYQIECKRRKKMVAGTTTAAAAAPPPTALPYRVSSLLVDFSFPNLPVSAHCQVLSGHTASVKCLEFVPKTSLVVSGGGDSQVLLWDLDQASASGSGTTTGPKAVGLGHSARVWDVSANHDGSRAASVSADSSLRIWDLTMDCGVSSVKIDTQHENDIYSVRFHPNSRNHVLTCGHDQTTKLVDVETSQVVKVFRGHTGSVVHAVFNPVGNLIATGSKDSAIKFFDAVSGVCVKTLPPQLGEVASVQFSQSGDKVLTATKDSTHRLWDVRHGGGGGGGGNNNNAAVPAVKFKGHVNSSKSFIRAQFGSTDNTVLSGSENGVVYVWDAVTGEVLERLLGHQGSVFRANWSRELDCMASCAEDGAVRIWKSNAL